jgi:hypothetical protein
MKKKSNGTNEIVEHFYHLPHVQNVCNYSPFNDISAVLSTAHEEFVCGEEHDDNNDDDKRQCGIYFSLFNVEVISVEIFF